MERMLPLSCATAEHCNDAVGTELAIPFAVVAAMLLLGGGVALFRKRHTQWTFLLGLLAIVTGTALTFGPGAETTYGWFAYAERTGEVFPARPPLSARGVAGVIVGATGLLVAGIGIGGMLRRPRSQD
ncbi:hypothetical protein OH146_11915 [Salinibacterium sp. SYSU T00001]|uniref:hypothetical protein n=1 Tax=Homoserinimonas sedimenticola TaxID=2986805 RepID=UPI0022360192|nr:hypothetical protein [Salinibacterium sedimenticola]MCW4386479.1 hypothetical protein [Salinibacterium sedimenticola]